MIDILTLIPGKKKKTGKGWWSFNAPCCHHLGHRQDTRGRGGIVFERTHDWTYSCFNCHFSCRFTLGKTISHNTRRFLRWLGVDDEEINQWSFESFQQRDLIEIVKEKRKKIKVNFKSVSLPPAELIDETNPEHQRFVDYVHSRGLSISDYPMLVTPNDPGRNSNRIIIPYTFNDRIVGHISRYLDDRTPKYIKEQQPGYIFGYDMQRPEWEVCIVVEGVFDALSVNGCALTHDTISEEQAELLRDLHRTIIVVPDRDEAGFKICDQALEMGFHVSIPNWEPGIKDANDAVVKYGKLPTIMSIVQSATRSRIKVEMKRRKFQ